ncbi:hypothetical protein [Actinomadura roseirufa]|uniref:hypothetical protein n=1 Tax=Actinomadura roseirufa TaxID=2094049 RepID=UPI001040EC98|nr:hypothetical protein [Actinomadura roseirufa]
MAHHPCAPLYSWDVKGRDGAGAGGVTDDCGEAVRQVDAALRDAPFGTRGVVRKVELSPSGQTMYLDRGEVARALKGPDTVVWAAW